MSYLNIEIKKIRKSKLGLITFITVCFFTVTLYAIFRYTDKEMSVFKFFFRVFAGLNYLPFIIPAIVFISLLFAKEFQDRTMIYTFLRPVKYYKLFFSKMLAAFLYSIFIVVIIFFATFLYG
ncbi:TPA: ABC transporter permease, partial [Clostridium sporogenes]